MNTQCPHCHVALDVDDLCIGQEVECPSCHNKFCVPPISKSTGPTRVEVPKYRKFHSENGDGATSKEAVEWLKAFALRVLAVVVPVLGIVFEKARVRWSAASRRQRGIALGVGAVLMLAMVMPSCTTSENSSGDALFGVRLGERGRDIPNREYDEPLKHEGETIYFFKPEDTSWGLARYIAKVDQDDCVFYICGMKTCHSRDEGLRVLYNVRQKLEQDFGRKMKHVDKDDNSVVYAISFDDKDGVLEKGLLAQCEESKNGNKCQVSVELFDVKKNIQQGLQTELEQGVSTSDREYQRLKAWYQKQLNYNGMSERHFESNSQVIYLSLRDDNDPYAAPCNISLHDGKYLSWPRNMAKGFAEELLEARQKIYLYEKNHK